MLPGLALEASKVYVEGKRGLGSSGNRASVCCRVEMLTRGVREGKASASGHFEAERASRCCFLGIAQLTDRKAS